MYVEYYNYNLDGEIVNECIIAINRTFFDSHVLYIKGEFTANWSAQPIDYFPFPGEKKAIKGKLSYKNKDYNISANAQDLQKFEGQKQDKDNQTKFENCDKIYRAKNAKFKISVDNKFISDISNVFLATKFVCRYYSDKKGEKVNIGENINCTVCYQVKEYTPYITINVIETNPCTSVIELDEHSIEPELCRKIESRFSRQQIAYHNKSKDKGNDNCIKWNTPTDWMAINELSKHNDLNKAVYMWEGYDKNNSAIRYLYIGIIGAQNASQNSINRRISTEIKQFSDINVERFRYSALKEHGVFDASEILKTVEMQCINNISALFPFKLGNDDIIHPIYSQVGIENKGYLIKLANKSKRFRN